MNSSPTLRPSALRRTLPEPIWLEWLALAGLLLFGAWVLGVRGVWELLLHADPTGLTAVIVVVFVAASGWAGQRARDLQRQRDALAALQRQPPSGRALDTESWAADYLAGITADPSSEAAALDILAEHTHGPHGTAWWVNGIQLKLGLLGKVIGFSVLALQIGQIQSFDAGESQVLLRSLTSGLGIALLTTMVGLVGNILLGLQLVRLDRFADALVADCQRAGIARRAALAAESPATPRDPP